MPQFRQSGANGSRNGVVSDHLPLSVRGGSRQFHHRRSKAPPPYKISLGFCVLILALILSISAFFYFALQSKAVESNRHQTEDEDISNDTDFLMDVTRIQRPRELKFGDGSVAHGRDSRYWDRDDRRRDEDYTEEEQERAQNVSEDKVRFPVNRRDKVSSNDRSSDHHRNGLYNEAGRNELKMYEAEYEASLKSNGKSTDQDDHRNQQSQDTDGRGHRALDEMDEYDDGIDLQDDLMDESNDTGNDDIDHSTATKPHSGNRGASLVHDTSKSKQHNNEEVDEASADSYGQEQESLSDSQQVKFNLISEQASSAEGQPVKRFVPEKRPGSKKKSKRRKFSGSCEMKFMDASALIVEPIESRKFARFSLQYTEREEKPTEDENWQPRFAGHQSLLEREESFNAQDQNINCGFVKGPKGSASTGFDIAEDDAKYISSCHIAVMSCIFGNSDRLRSPISKAVSRMSRKNVCFVMFVDEVTLQTLSSEGQMPDTMGFVGLWKIVVVKNLPYTDMRRVGKIPKLLPHRLFTSARYSIWLDSKLRLQLDPMLILEYFLWRKGHEYAISNHYDRHCLWEEVAQNKKLNKYNHTVIDEQFAFYQADGMRRFNASDPGKLLPSNVPEGSFIVRAHTPMSNLFSCLWFNEVERFTPRDQLSFAYTYHKLRRTNPEKPFYLNMFKDCERRKIAKLYHHRSEEKRKALQHETG
ncbi:probable hexosyltransferase MUCI70 isoform X1 [Salvia splendens]|uniref:probable hexosyltransferase MUCI70 isoform X1 n=1 Tax=Salvia splendens TaxID=180675 RepID=UPI001C25A846|nr:probable hexosyltransferase MUCI70 isoform X1 [Salvia splendens]